MGILSKVSGVFLKSEDEVRAEKSSSQEDAEKRLWVLKGGHGTGDTWEEEKEKRKLEQQIGDLKRKRNEESYSKRDVEQISDRYLEKKYDYGEKNFLGRAIEGGLQKVGFIEKPKDEWLEEKRAEEEIKRAEREAYKAGSIKGVSEKSARDAYSKYVKPQKSNTSKEKLEELRLQKQMIGLEREKMRLQHQRASGAAKYARRYAERPQESSQIQQPQQYGWSPMAGLEKFGGAPGGWSPMAGLEKFMGPQSEGRGSGGMPDFSRFTHSDPTAGLSKMWGTTSERKMYSPKKRTKHHKKRRR
jgi:hypothetical protein